MQIPSEIMLTPLAIAFAVGIKNNMHNNDNLFGFLYKHVLIYPILLVHLPVIGWSPGKCKNKGILITINYRTTKIPVINIITILITCDHYNFNSCSSTCHHSLCNSRPWRINHGDKTSKCHAIFYKFEIIWVKLKALWVLIAG